MFISEEALDKAASDLELWNKVWRRIGPDLWREMISLKKQIEVPICDKRIPLDSRSKQVLSPFIESRSNLETT